MNENEGLRLLAPLRELDPDTQSSVDIDKAKRLGRRTSRRRAVVGAAAVVGVFALVGIGVPALSGAFTRGAVAPAVTSAEFNPLVEVVTVGTAGGFRPNWYKTGQDRQTIELVRADGGTGGGTITVYPPGVQPDDPNQKLPSSDMHMGSVSFEWTRGAWAHVSLGGPEPDMQARAERVRQSVVAKSQRVKAPFSVAKSALGDMKPAVVTRMYDEREPIKLTVEFSPSGRPERGGMAFTATVGAYGPGSKEDIGGHEATVVGNEYGVEYIGISDRGSTMNLTVWNVGDQLPLAKQVISSVRFVPDATNPANWVEEVVR
ncbi:hypothetical protein DMH04_36600 [Kibdelosporangium aridum]|uniref:Uncharacterized protein n=1 Tax=Kibdelosporangium aridum TaxID=2030 RepID=A0A428YYX6_KIBAR|nr:hypothetical protein [Kibdelosporangium aridum]RSM76032.1 hypothetical protein DMH04_36600 [Kibdelosporangium aridum]